jgi:phosphatidylglycerophosphatase A
MTIQRFFLTFGGSGLSPKAPGTMGTLASLPFGIAILHYFGIQTLFMVTLATTIIAIFEINKYEKVSGIHDNQEIVIDEAVGVWIAFMIAYSTAITVSYPYAYILAIVLSFGTFRLFDILKPSTIGWIDREVGGGLGVMGDDILAGIAGGMLSVLVLIGIDKVI